MLCEHETLDRLHFCRHRARVIAPLEHQNLLEVLVGRCDRDSNHELGCGVRQEQRSPRNPTLKVLTVELTVILTLTGVLIE